MKNVLIGFLGVNLDRRGKKQQRWDKWRPTVSLCQHEDFIVHRLELLVENHAMGLARLVRDDIAAISPETEVVFHSVNLKDPWDLESVYSRLLDFAEAYDFEPEDEQYLLHITTGTHVVQICWYLLTESGHLPAKLIQSSPPGRDESVQGHYQIIDLDLSKYDQIASRFRRQHVEATTFLKGGIQTRNKYFNTMIEQLEQVSIRSTEPILLAGPTGAGKSQLAQRVFELRKQQGLLQGELVVVNCATLRGDNAMSALFGHKKGAFTGAASNRAGLLKEAHQGLLFLDEVGELGLDEQAMLLRAIEDKRFMPLGADREEGSDFQLIAGSNRDLVEDVHQGLFREDLLARINLWTYELPSLRDRLEDIEANIEYELQKWAAKQGNRVTFNKEAKDKYLRFARSARASWRANFRDLNASITRMATLATNARINETVVLEEIKRLEKYWQVVEPDSSSNDLSAYLNAEQISDLDLFDRLQLSAVIKVCRESRSMAEAGRRLFGQSRLKRTSVNDSHRVKQFLAKYDLSFADLR